MLHASTYGTRHPTTESLDLCTLLRVTYQRLLETVHRTTRARTLALPALYCGIGPATPAVAADPSLRAVIDWFHERQRLLGSSPNVSEGVESGRVEAVEEGLSSIAKVASTVTETSIVRGPTGLSLREVEWVLMDNTAFKEWLRSARASCMLQEVSGMGMTT